MSFNQRYESQDFTKYDSMSTEELGKILEAEPLKPREDQLPDDELLYISEVYCNRFDMQKIFPKTNEEYLAEFTTFRASLSEEDLSFLLEQEETDLKKTLAVLKQVSKRKSTKHTRRLPVRKLAVIAATVAVAFSLIMLPVNASGNSVLDTIVIWAKETFQFVSRDSGTDDFVENTEFQEFLLQYDVTEPVPSLIPAGFELFTTNADIQPLQSKFLANYTDSNNHCINISIKTKISGSPSYVEQLGGTYETIKIARQEYFIFDNTNCLTAVWLTDTHECILSGNLSVAQIETMLDSIARD